MSWFGPFRSTLIQLGGRLNKIPAKLSITRKANARKRLRSTDRVIQALEASGVQLKGLDVALQNPMEHQMNTRNKYWVFARNHPGLKKGIHRVPKFTKVELPRVWPKGLISALK